MTKAKFELWEKPTRMIRLRTISEAVSELYRSRYMEKWREFCTYRERVRDALPENQDRYGDNINYVDTVNLEELQKMSIDLNIPANKLFVTMKNNSDYYSDYSSFEILYEWIEPDEMLDARLEEWEAWKTKNKDLIAEYIEAKWEQASFKSINYENNLAKSKIRLEKEILELDNSLIALSNTDNKSVIESLTIRKDKKIKELKNIQNKIQNYQHVTKEEFIKIYYSDYV